MTMKPFRRLGVAASLASLVALSMGGPAAAVPASPVLPAVTCDSTQALTVLDFNDFHGRIATSSPDTLAFVSTIERERKDAPDDTIVLSSGDNIGASLFASFIQADQPTIDLLNALELDASAVGNHEFDRGWDDLKTRVINGGNNAAFSYLAANVRLANGDLALPAYRVVQKGGLTVGIVGAVTSELPSLVSPSGLTGITVTDPVAAVNKTIAELKDGNPANGEADVILVSYHEGAPTSSTAPEIGQDANMDNATFAALVNRTDTRAQAIFTAHTHQTYAYKDVARNRMVVQAGSYASNLAKVVLNVDATTGETCSTSGAVQAIDSTVDTTLPRVQAAKTIIDGALEQAKVLGAVVVGSASAPVSRALTVTGNPPVTSDDRARESTMTNMVAQMFAEVLGGDNPDFIGLQNPGGTRADFAQGNLTYAQAAAVLPFANTLATTTITGAQFKIVLEQQWQRTSAGAVPSRPFLRLGISDNVTYTYDESRPEGDRITSIMVNGAAIKPQGTYTIGSGSFLISGGDNFWELAKGTKPVDSGRADLEAWVAWLKARGTVKPDFTMRGVSVHDLPTTLVQGTPVAFSVGAPQMQKAAGRAAGETQAVDTLDFKSNGIVNDALSAKIAGVVVGSARLVDGAASLTVALNAEAVGALQAKAGGSPTSATLELVASGSGTTLRIPVQIVLSDRPTSSPSASTPGRGSVDDLAATGSGEAGSAILGGILFAAGTGMLLSRRRR